MNNVFIHILNKICYCQTPYLTREWKWNLYLKPVMHVDITASGMNGLRDMIRDRMTHQVVVIEDFAPGTAPRVSDMAKLLKFKSDRMFDRASHQWDMLWLDGSRCYELYRCGKNSKGDSNRPPLGTYTWLLDPSLDKAAAEAAKIIVEHIDTAPPVVEDE